MTGPPIAIAPFDGRRGAEALIVETWVAAAWRNSPQHRRSLHQEVWESAWKWRIEKILDQLDTRILLAVNPERTSQIHGWICYDKPEDHDLPMERGPVVHFAYVKKAFRRFGIATALVSRAAGRPSPGEIIEYDGDTPLIMPPIYPLIVTHWTRLCEDWAPGMLHYRPSLFKIRRGAKLRSKETPR